MNAREGWGVDEGRTDGIEEQLEGAKEGFAEEGVEDESFEGGGEVCVKAGYAEGFMVG